MSNLPVLTETHLTLMMAIYASPGSKYPEGLRSDDGESLWPALEAHGLIAAIGSYKWVMTDVGVEKVKAALTLAFLAPPVYTIVPDAEFLKEFDAVRDSMLSQRIIVEPLSRYGFYSDPAPLGGIVPSRKGELVLQPDEVPAILSPGQEYRAAADVQSTSKTYLPPIERHELSCGDGGMYNDVTDTGEWVFYEDHVLHMRHAADERERGTKKIQLAAVAVMRESLEDGLQPEWLLEGGTAELEAGMLLLVADDESICEEDGSAEVLYVAEDEE